MRRCACISRSRLQNSRSQTQAFSSSRIQQHERSSLAVAAAFSDVATQSSTSHTVLTPFVFRASQPLNFGILPNLDSLRNQRRHMATLQTSEKGSSNRSWDGDTPQNELLSLDEASLNEETERLLSQLNPSYEMGQSDGGISHNDCYDVLEAWKVMARKTQRIEAAQIAHRFLLAMPPAVLPSRLCSDTVLHAYVLSGKGKEAALYAQNLLKDMVAASTESPETALKADRLGIPSSKSFNIVINAWAKSRAHEAGEQSAAVLEELEKFHASQMEKYVGDVSSYNAQRDTAPNVRSLTGVVDSWNRQQGAPDQIMKVFNRAIRGHLGQDENNDDDKYTKIELDVPFFNAVIRSLGRSLGNQEGAERAEHVLKTMKDIDGISPLSQTYAMVIHAWAKCESFQRNGDAAKRSEEILKLVIRLAFEEGQNVKPNTKVFTSCISAWGRCSHRVGFAAKRAQELYELQINLYKKTGDEEFKPDITAGNAVIHAWAQSIHETNDHLQRARSFFQRMKDGVGVDIFSYNILLHAYSRIRDAKSALALFEELESKARENPRLQPDEITHSTLLHAFSQSRSKEAALIAEKLLDHTPHPSNQSFTNVIMTWERSGDDSSTQHIRRLFHRMVEQSSTNHQISPDCITYTAIIRACSREKVQKEEALQTVLDAILHMSQSPVPSDFRLFCAGLEACRNLSSNDMEFIRYASQVASACQSEGLLSRRFLDILRLSARDRLMYNEILGLPREFGNGPLPAEWTANLNILSSRKS